MVEDRPARLGGAAGGVAGGARLVQVLRLPAEARRTQPHQDRKVVGGALAERHEVPSLLHAHEIGPQRQHHRRLDLARMNAVALLLRVDQPRGRPSWPQDSEATSMSWSILSCRATICITWICPPWLFRIRSFLRRPGRPRRRSRTTSGQRLGRVGQRARIVHMLLAPPHPAHRQDQRRQRLGHQLDGAAHDALD